jgi:hypothetical protein
MTTEEMEPINAWDPIQHDPDDCVATMKVMGIPGGVNRALAEADWCVSIGVCELHQYAGLSGGHKGVSVGCASRESIAALHHRDFFTQPGVTVGRVDGNPFRETVDSLGRAARCHLALNWVPSLGLWLAGSPERVIREALRRMKPWSSVSSAATGARVRVPASKARSFYQASRAATYLGLSPRPPLQDGAIIAIDACCNEGLGSETGFTQAIESCASPWTELLEGSPPEGAGAQRAVMLAMLAQRYRIRVYGCSQPQELIDRGIWASGEPAPLESGWLDIEAPFDRLPQLEGTG